MRTAWPVARTIRRHGEPLTLELMDGANVEATLTDLRAKRNDVSGSTLAGDLQQITTTFRFAGLDFDEHSPEIRGPRKFDRITDASGAVFMVDKVDTRKDGGIVLMYIVAATGDA